MKLLINEKKLLINEMDSTFSLFFIIVAEVSIVAGNWYRTIAKVPGDNRSIDNERGCYDALSRGESTSFSYPARRHRHSRRRSLSLDA